MYEFGCEYCAGVGYEDYPSSKIPCRIPGHLQRHQLNVAEAQQIINTKKRRKLPIDGPCPYCKKNEECEHWTGIGWIKTPQHKQSNA